MTEVFAEVRLCRTKASSLHSDIPSCLMLISPGQLTCKSTIAQQSYLSPISIEVAKVVLDKCTLSPPNCPDSDEPYYSVMFNYEFVEDFQDEQQDE